VKDWESIYKSRVVNADEAVLLIKDNNRIVVGHSNGEPLILTEALARNYKHFHNVEVLHMVVQGPCKYTQPGMESHFWHNSLFVGGPVKEHINNNRGDFTPCHFHQIPYLFDDVLPVDVALVQVTNPDKDGYVNFGVSVDYTLPAARAAKHVIAEVNNQYPYMFGDAKMHVSEIAAFVETSHPLSSTASIPITDVESKIGKLVADLVPDEATLQFGIGGIPNAVLSFLGDKKDMGVHTEMLTDNMAGLIECGAINNSKKGFHDGVCIGTALMGSPDFQRYVDHNPRFEMYPVNYVNDPRNIAKCKKLISINSCVQVDFMGQVCSEMVGPTQISGIGGQVDFIRGARWSEGGKSIIACYSTAQKGAVSKIVPALDQGCCVTTSRADVDFIVTEYGVISLRGMGIRARARALINIAHPKFRDQLWEAYEKMYGPRYVSIGINNL